MCNPLSAKVVWSHFILEKGIETNYLVKPVLLKSGVTGVTVALFIILTMFDQKMWNLKDFFS